MVGVEQSQRKSESEIDVMFESYVSKYAKSRGISVAEARTHKLVSEYRSYCEHEFGGKI